MKRAVAQLVWLLASLTCAADGVRSLVVGGFDPTGSAAFLAAWRPVFETFLSSASGLNVSLVYLANQSAVAAAVAEQSVDALFLSATQLACASRASAASLGAPLVPLATLALLSPSLASPFGSATPQDTLGSVLFALASRADVGAGSGVATAVAGLRFAGKQTESGLLLPALALSSANASLASTPRALLLAPATTSGGAAVLAAVAAGFADVGALRAGQLEAAQVPLCGAAARLSPAPACYGAGTFKAVAATGGVAVSTDGGGAFPYALSTPTLPERAVAVLPHVPAAARKAVATALFALNGTSNASPSFASASAAGAAFFATPADYGPAADDLVALGLLPAAGAGGLGGACADLTLPPASAAPALLPCPVGTFEPAPSRGRSCAAVAGASPCPSGFSCSCAVCVPTPPVRFLLSFTPSPSASANASSASPSSSLLSAAGVAASCAQSAVCAVATVGVAPGNATLTDTWAGASGAAAATGAEPTARVCGWAPLQSTLSCPRRHSRLAALFCSQSLTLSLTHSLS